MKRIILLLLFANIGIVFAQDVTEIQNEIEINKIEDTSLRYDPHSLGISLRFGGLANNRTGGIYEHVGVYNTVFEFYTRERKGKTKYTPMVGIRLSQPLGGSNPYIYGGFRWGFLFGGSQYVFDKRSVTTGTGWSMLVNGGVTADMASIKEILEITKHPISLGAELDFKAIYNVHKYVGVTFGFYMGYVASIDAYNMVDALLSPSDDETIDDAPSLNIDHGFTWGLSIGMIF